MSSEKFLDDIFQENGISKIIMSYKYDLELCSSIYKYDKNNIIYNLNYFKNKKNWDSISREYYLSYDFIKKYINKLDINIICKFQKLHVIFIEELLNMNIKIDWDSISCHSKINNIKFVNKYKDLLNWKYICTYQVLSEEFMNNFINYLKWDEICIYQKLSKKFMTENLKKLNKKILPYYQDLNILIEILPEHIILSSNNFEKLINS